MFLTAVLSSTPTSKFQEEHNFALCYICRSDRVVIVNSYKTRIFFSKIGKTVSVTPSSLQKQGQARYLIDQFVVGVISSY